MLNKGNEWPRTRQDLDRQHSQDAKTKPLLRMFGENYKSTFQRSRSTLLRTPR